MIPRQRSVITKRKAATGKNKQSHEDIFVSFQKIIDAENGNKMFVALTIVWELRPTL